MAQPFLNDASSLVSLLIENSNGTFEAILRRIEFDGKTGHAPVQLIPLSGAFPSMPTHSSLGNAMSMQRWMEEHPAFYHKAGHHSNNVGNGRAARRCQALTVRVNATMSVRREIYRQTLTRRKYFRLKMGSVTVCCQSVFRYSRMPAFLVRTAHTGTCGLRRSCRTDVCQNSCGGAPDRHYCQASATLAQS